MGSISTVALAIIIVGALIVLAGLVGTIYGVVVVQKKKYRPFIAIGGIGFISASMGLMLVPGCIAAVSDNTLISDNTNGSALEKYEKIGTKEVNHPYSTTIVIGKIVTTQWNTNLVKEFGGYKIHTNDRVKLERTPEYKKGSHHTEKFATLWGKKRVIRKETWYGMTTEVTELYDTHLYMQDNINDKWW